jgi:hypothetical protein
MNIFPSVTDGGSLRGALLDSRVLALFDYEMMWWHRLERHPDLATGAFVLVLVLVLVFYRACRRSRRTLEVFSNQSGRVHVSRSALGDLVESAAVQFGVASRPRVDFVNRAGKIHLNIHIKLSAGQRLPEFSAGLQKHLADTLRDSFGLDNLGGIHLTITGFKGRPLPASVEDVPRPLSRPATPPPPSPAGDFFSR